MTSIEKTVKDRFSVYFKKEDWQRFKSVADYYFQRAVFYKKADIDISLMTDGRTARLLARNIQKRLDIGIGVELLVKSFYLKEGYFINRVKDWKEKKKDFPFELTGDEKDFQIDETFTLNLLIQNINKVKEFENKQAIDSGFRVAKVFRNKEGHVVTRSHEYDGSDYAVIETALSLFYKEAFDETLKVQFSVESKEKGIWELN